MRYALKNFYLLDGTETMEPVSGMAVMIEDGIITDILPEEDADFRGYKAINLTGAYLLPGLINLHAHLALPGSAPKSDRKINYSMLFELLKRLKPLKDYFRKMNENNAYTELMSGVTTLRTVGGILDFDGRIRDAINEGKLVGPRILCANTAVSVPGGHFAGSIATEASSPEEAAEHVRRIAATNPDLIKLMITGGVMDASASGEPGVLRMSKEIVKAACEEAHRLGYKAAAHVESQEGLIVALENGVDTIEHGAEPSEEAIRLFQERGAVDICTISPVVPYVEFELSESRSSAIAKENAEIVGNGIVSCARTCLDNGIPVGLGNDTGCSFITHYNFWRELYYFHKRVGVSNAFALYTATLGNARIAGVDDITGSIEKGKSADLLIVRENPLEDLRALRKPELVFMHGEMHRSPAIRRFKDVDALLDKYMD